METKVTGAECEVASGSVPLANMLKLYWPHWGLPTVVMKGAPAEVGVTLAGAAVQVGGAPGPQLRFTGLL